MDNVAEKQSDTGSDTDKKIVGMVMKMFDQGKAARKKVDKNWPKQQDYYDGKQWDDRRPSYRASPVANVIRSTVQTILPIMTDAQPGFNVAPQEPRDHKFADMMGKLTQFWWNRNGMNMVLLDPLMDQMVKDIGYLKVIWDDEAANGAGDVHVAAISPESIYVPDSAKDFNTDCPWVIHEMWKPMGEVKRKFPDKAEEIKSSSKTKSQEDKDDTYKGDVTLVSPIDRKSPLSNVVDIEGDTGENDMIRIFECWMDDYTIEEFEEETGEGVVKNSRYKYPNGKVVQLLPDQKLLLDCTHNHRKDGKKPFVRFIDTIKPRSFYGEGVVGPMVDTQRNLNKTLAVIFDQLNLMSNPIWIIDTTCGVTSNDITNQVGLIITKVPGSEVRRLDAPQLPSYIMDLYGLMMQLLDQTSGVHDVTQGRKPAGVTAAAAINDLQEAAQTRIRLKERNLQVSLTSLGYLIISTMMQYYREPRVVKITGDGGWPEYFEFYFKDVDKDENPDSPDDAVQYVKKEYKYDEESKDYNQATEWEESEPSKGMFDVEVISGTALPFMKDKRSQLAMRLFEMGVIDEEALLKMIDWPEREETLRRIEERKKAMAEQQPPAMPPV